MVVAGCCVLLRAAAGRLLQAAAGGQVVAGLACSLESSYRGGN